MIKRILILFMLFLTIFSTVNAGTTILNSCGKNSGWLDNELYLINFTSIPGTYTNDFCLEFPRFGNLNNINITFVDPTDTLTYNGGLTNFKFLEVNSNNEFNFVDLYDMNFKNFYSFIHVNTYANSNIFGRWKFSKISNINYDGQYFMSWFWNTAGFNGLVKNFEFTSTEMNNLYIQTSVAFTNTEVYRADARPVTELLNITSSIFVNNPSNLIYDPASSNSGHYFTLPFHNSVIIGTENAGAIGLTKSSIFKGFPHVDSDDDGLADANIHASKTDMVTYLDIQGYNIFQDFNEGEAYWTIIGGDVTVNLNQDNIFVEDEQIIGSGNLFAPIGTPNNKNSELSATFIIDLYKAFIINGGIDCSIVSSAQCLVQDSPTYTATATTKFRGFLSLGSDTLINNVNFDKLASNDGHILANFNDVFLDNITISNNNFFKNDGNFKFNDNYLIKLKSNNIIINNNIFNLSENTDNGYEILDIESTNLNSNQIYENSFIFNGVVSTTPSFIFTDNADTVIYNNFIGNDVELSDTNKINLKTDKTISLIQGNTVYYWTIGNFYESNTACIDSDLNGICDSPYTSGGNTDDFPLVSSPFIPLNHLLTADATVTLGLYNITLINLIENETVNLVDGTETLTFSFSQDSEFPDLTCDYVLDGSFIGQQLNPLQNIQYNLNQTGEWIEKSYSFRVECVNDAQGTVISDELTFNIVLTPVGGNGNGNGNETTDSSIFNDFTGSQIIDVDDLEGTAQNTGSFMADLVAFLLNFGVPFMIMLFIIGLILGVITIIS